MNEILKFITSMPMVLLMCSTMGVAIASLVKVIMKKVHAKKQKENPDLPDLCMKKYEYLFTAIGFVVGAIASVLFSLFLFKMTNTWEIIRNVALSGSLSTAVYQIIIQPLRKGGKFTYLKIAMLVAKLYDLFKQKKLDKETLKQALLKTASEQGDTVNLDSLIIQLAQVTGVPQKNIKAMIDLLVKK